MDKLTCTDEEIEALEESMKRTRYSVGPQLVKAIINRLKAAEEVIRLSDFSNRLNTDECHKAFHEWRETAGR